jgi:predicted RNase H-like nuclease
MFVAGVDGCRAGWIAFKVDVPSLDTSVDVVDLPKLLSRRPVDLFCAAIDIPIGLLDYSRAGMQFPKRIETKDAQGKLSKQP